MSYYKEFPLFADDANNNIPFNPSDYGLVDTSYHNDTCPSFSIVDDSDEIVERLWVDYRNPTDREEPEAGGRFMYEAKQNGEFVLLCNTDDAHVIMSFLKSRFK